MAKNCHFRPKNLGTQKTTQVRGICTEVHFRYHEKPRIIAGTSIPKLLEEGNFKNNKKVEKAQIKWKTILRKKCNLFFVCRIDSKLSSRRDNIVKSAEGRSHRPPNSPITFCLNYDACRHFPFLEQTKIGGGRDNDPPRSPSFRGHHSTLGDHRREAALLPTYPYAKHRNNPNLTTHT